LAKSALTEYVGTVARLQPSRVSSCDPSRAKPCPTIMNSFEQASSQTLLTSVILAS